jgi:hypothetical protein
MTIKNVYLLHCYYYYNYFESNFEFNNQQFYNELIDHSLDFKSHLDLHTIMMMMI